VATTAADNGGLIMTEGVEKNGFCVFSILMSPRRPSVRTAELFPPFSEYPVSIKLYVNQFVRGHPKKGESTEAFADGVTDVISKGVLHYINLPVGEGSDGGSPKNKRKGGGVGAPADT
jgi:hypothetical protein